MEQPRQPLPAAISHSAKRHAGRTGPSATPLNLRTHGVPVDGDLEEHVRDRVGRKIGKFALHVQRVTVRFEDINGPKGGVDVECKIKVVLIGAPTVMAAERAPEARAAFDAADAAAQRALKHALGRHYSKR